MNWESLAENDPKIADFNSQIKGLLQTFNETYNVSEQLNILRQVREIVVAREEYYRTK